MYYRYFSERLKSVKHINQKIYCKYNHLLHSTVTSSMWVQLVTEVDGQELLVP